MTACIGTACVLDLAVPASLVDFHSTDNSAEVTSDGRLILDTSICPDVAWVLKGDEISTLTRITFSLSPPLHWGLRAIHSRSTQVTQEHPVVQRRARGPPDD